MNVKLETLLEDPIMFIMIFRSGLNGKFDPKLKMAVDDDVLKEVSRAVGFTPQQF